MQKFRLLTITLLAIVSFPILTIGSVPQEVTAPKPIAGIWLGVLEVSTFKLRLVLKVTQTPDGKLSAKLDSLDQAAGGVLL